MLNKMTRSSCQLSFVLFFLFCVLKIGNGMQCYSCSGTNVCRDPVNVTSLNKVYCNERNNGCMKEISNGNIVDRGCTTVAFCEALKSKTEFCSVCTEDLCNSTSIVMPSVAVLFLSAIIKSFMFRN